MNAHAAFRVAIANTGESFRCAATRSLLAAMEALGRTGIPVGCRGGGCGVCKVRVDAGRVRTDTMSRACLTPEEERRGVVLACRAYPVADLSVTAVDRLARCIERGSERRPPDSFLARATVSSASPTTNEGDTPWL